MGGLEVWYSCLCLESGFLLFSGRVSSVERIADRLRKVWSIGFGFGFWVLRDIVMLRGGEIHVD